MNSALQKEKALAFRKLHQGPPILVLPNAWDCLSAWTFEQAGFPAVATTSGGIASLFGYPDGQRIPSRLMLGMAGRITSVVSIPVTADLEAGYGSTPLEVAETITGAIKVGLVGANLEDSTGDPERPLNETQRQVEIIKAARQAADRAGLPFFINARTDVFVRGPGDETSRLQEAVGRAVAYREAGADGIFVIGVKDRDLIAKLVRQIHAPINILAGPGSPPIAELQELGVARVSFGSGLLRGTLPLLRDMARELRQTGACQALEQTEFSHIAINQLFEAKLGTKIPDWPTAATRTAAPRPTGFENLTPLATRALALARREAEQLNHNFLGTEHVLLGLIALGQGVAITVLSRLGLNLEEVRKAVEKQISRGPDQGIVFNIPYTPRVRKVLALAAEDAKALHHAYVGTEHLLLGLLQEQEGLAGRVLRNFRVDLELTRREILKELDPNFGG